MAFERAFRYNLLFVPHKRISTAIPNALTVTKKKENQEKNLASLLESSKHKKNETGNRKQDTGNMTKTLRLSAFARKLRL